MHVLAVTSEWPTPDHPGSGTFVARQVEAIRAIGVDVDVEHFRGASNPLNYVTARRRVAHRLLSESFDILHAHFGQAGIAAGGSPVPLVVTFYGSDLEGIVGPRGTYTARGRLLIRLSRRVARRADHVILVSPSLVRRLPARTDYSVVPTAVDLGVFRPAPKDEARRTLSLPLDRKLVLFAGRPEVPVKRYELARRAVEVVAIDEPVELLTITGLEPKTVATYMQACDALLLTSRHEGAPTIVKESLACLLPVVSVDVGDVRQTIGSIPGCVVTGDDRAESLGHALAHILQGPRVLDAKSVPVDLDQATQAARVVEIYERVLRGRSR